MKKQKTKLKQKKESLRKKKEKGKKKRKKIGAIRHLAVCHCYVLFLRFPFTVFFLSLSYVIV